jgi:hypothetical protein
VIIRKSYKFYAAHRNEELEDKYDECQQSQATSAVKPK